LSSPNVAMDKTIIGIAAVVMILAAAAAISIAQPVFASDDRTVVRDNNRNNVNVCNDCQAGQNSGDNSLNTGGDNGGIFQSR
jgi:5,10-methenyltetrahydromethanopterin hydrogenase